jgi:hypothetical protein
MLTAGDDAGDAVDDSVDDTAGDAGDCDAAASLGTVVIR